MYISFKKLKWHAEQNKQGLNNDDTLVRYNKFINWYKNINNKNYLIYKIDDNGKFFNDNEIYNIIINIKNYLKLIFYYLKIFYFFIN